MKTMQIKRAALAAAILAGVGMAYGAESALQVVYCKATIVGNSGGDVVSVTLPPTEGYYDKDGNPLTYWNVGNVPKGGVADSWHGEGGPGRFTARNEGTVGAYFYVTTCRVVYLRFTSATASSNSVDPWYYIEEGTFGTNLYKLECPCISPSELRRYHWPHSYHLAFTTDTVAKVPTWHSLDHRLVNNSSSSSYSWSTTEGEPAGMEVAGYMGYVDAGDYLTFDLKLWTSREAKEGGNLFTFCVEASSFPLWEHGSAVE